MVTGAMAVGDIEAFIDRIQRLEDQRSALGCSIHDLFAAAKAIGLDTNVMRRAIRLRSQEPGENAPQRDARDAYNEAVGIKLYESWF